MHHGSLEPEDALLEVLAAVGRRVAEHVVLEDVGAILQLLYHREIAVDDFVDQRVGREPTALVREQVRLTLPPSPRLLDRERGRSVPQRPEEATTDERVDLLVPQLGAVRERQGPQCHEGVSLEHLDLRTLLPVARILERERMQTEGLADRREVLVARIGRIEPDEDVLLYQELLRASETDRTVVRRAAAVDANVDHRPETSAPGC